MQPDQRLPALLLGGDIACKPDDVGLSLPHNDSARCFEAAPRTIRVAYAQHGLRYPFASNWGPLLHQRGPVKRVHKPKKGGTNQLGRVIAQYVEMGWANIDIAA